MRHIRFYNSAKTEDAGSVPVYGYGWRGSYSQYLTEVNSQTIILHKADGGALHFIYDSNSMKYKSEVGPIRKIAKTVTGYELTEPDGRTAFFNETGKLTLLNDRNGNQQIIGYDENAMIKNVTDNFGRRLSYNYYAEGVNAGKLEKLSYERESDTLAGDYIGVANYFYDYENNNLKTVIFPDTDGNPDNDVRSYQYEDPYESADERHNLTGIINEDEIRYLTFGYDNEDRADFAELAGGKYKSAIEYGDNIERVITDSKNRQTTFGLQAEKGIGRVKSAAGTGCKTCMTPVNTHYITSDRLLIGSAVDARGINTRHDYDDDGRGNITALTEAVDTGERRKTEFGWHPIYNFPENVTRKSLFKLNYHTPWFTAAAAGYDSNGNIDYIR